MRTWYNLKTIKVFPTNSRPAEFEALFQALHCQKNIVVYNSLESVEFEIDLNFFSVKTASQYLKFHSDFKNPLRTLCSISFKNQKISPSVMNQRAQIVHANVIRR